MSPGGAHTIRFQCRDCGVRLKVPSNLAGQEGQCPKCGKTFRAPTTSRRATSGAEPGPQEAQDGSDDIPVVCEVCGTRMYAKPGQVGKTVACPDCYHANVVTAKPLSSASARRAPKHLTLDDADEYRVRDDVDQPPPSDEILVPVVCTLCGTRMYASSEQIGQTIVCPDCETTNRVVAPARPIDRKFRPRPAGPLYDVGGPARVTEPQNIVRDMLDRAVNEAREKARKEPKPPRYPFLSGVYTFPFQLRIGAVCLTLALGTAMAIHLSLLADQIEPFFKPFVAAFAALIAAATYVVGSVFCINIVEKTANLADTVDEWPEFSVMDWILQSFYVANSLTISVLPMVFGLVQWMIARTPSMAWLGVLPTYLVFPIVLLSMLEECSPMMPYSKTVWRSLLRTWWAWAVFYVESLAFAGAIGGTIWATWSWDPMWAMVAVVTVAVLAMTLYFRLLGRLAWIIGRDQPIPDREVGSPDGDRFPTATA